jgi:alkaline phosphatase D
MMKSFLLLNAFLFVSISSIFGQVDRLKMDANLAPFFHGVASGDPLNDRVMLWTRITDDAIVSDSVPVQWRVATDTTMMTVVSSGTGYAKAANDWTFKVDAAGLQPNNWYYYDFFAQGKYSLRGRTKTLPVGDIDSVRLGVVSCSNWQYGYFGVYRLMKDRNDLDAILHLGDYIYEYEAGGYSANISDREHDPANEIITLTDYRTRHSQYKLDKDLRALHQQYPFINIWDDHESTNDSYKDGAENHTEGTEGIWEDRKGFSQRAFFEWLPVREIAPGSYSIYRNFEFGDLINLVMLDTRLEGRDEQVGATSSDVNSSSRTLLGTTQFNWLTSNLSASTKRWNIVGQQVMISPLLAFGVPVNADQWDGYAYERTQLLNHVQNNSISNFVVLTGDIHTSWVNDIPNGSYSSSNCAGSVGVEFVTTSVTSPGFPIGVGVSLIQSLNSHIQYTDLTTKGYGILNVTKQRTQFDFHYANDVADINTGGYFATGYYVNNNEKCANQASGQTVRAGTPPVLAPNQPISLSAQVPVIQNDFVIFGVYPNPAQDIITMQIYMPADEKLTIRMYAIDGKLVYQDDITDFSKGINYAQLNISSLTAGTYSIVLESDEYRASKTIIKK